MKDCSSPGSDGPRNTTSALCAAPRQQFVRVALRLASPIREVGDLRLRQRRVVDDRRHEDDVRRDSQEPSAVLRKPRQDGRGRAPVPPRVADGDRAVLVTVNGGAVLGFVDASLERYEEAGTYYRPGIDVADEMSGEVVLAVFDRTEGASAAPAVVRSLDRRSAGARAHSVCGAERRLHRRAQLPDHLRQLVAHNLAGRYKPGTGRGRDAGPRRGSSCRNGCWHAWRSSTCRRGGLCAARPRNRNLLIYSYAGLPSGLIQDRARFTRTPLSP
jgi:hypothetical protein